MATDSLARAGANAHYAASTNLKAPVLSPRLKSEFCVPVSNVLMLPLHGRCMNFRHLIALDVGPPLGVSATPLEACAPAVDIADAEKEGETTFCRGTYPSPPWTPASRPVILPQRSIRPLNPSLHSSRQRSTPARPPSRNSARQSRHGASANAARRSRQRTPS